MSETIVAPQASAESSPAGTEANANESDIFFEIENITNDSEQTDVPGEESPESAPETPKTPEEQDAHLRLERVTPLDAAVQEAIAPKIQKIGDQLKMAVLDKGLNQARKKLLLEPRQLALQKQIIRTQSSLNRTKKNSMRGRHLEKKLGKKHRLLNQTNRSVSRVAGAATERQAHSDHRLEVYAAEVNEKRELLIIAQKVAAERKRRRKLKKSIKYSIDSIDNPGRRQRMIAESKSWPSIQEYESELLRKSELLGKIIGNGHGGH